jgi:hypothetical protein
MCFYNTTLFSFVPTHHLTSKY